ncbi:MAG: hypothetical protein Q7P63_14530 [Verrucomicrobiota bacterium JB022]|nr:hypothetical protein [Verrucomicrobiota bacterium JB022]
MELTNNRILDWDWDSYPQFISADGQQVIRKFQYTGPAYYIARGLTGADSKDLGVASIQQYGNADTFLVSTDFQLEIHKSAQIVYPDGQSPSAVGLEMDAVGNYLVGYEYDGIDQPLPQLTDAARPFYYALGTKITIPVSGEPRLYASDIAITETPTVYGAAVDRSSAEAQHRHQIWKWSEGENSVTWVSILPDETYQLRDYEVSNDGNLVIGYFSNALAPNTVRLFRWTPTDGFSVLNAEVPTVPGIPLAPITIAANNQLALIGNRVWLGGAGLQTLEQLVPDWEDQLDFNGVPATEVDVGDIELVSMSSGGTVLGWYTFTTSITDPQPYNRTSQHAFLLQDLEGAGELVTLSGEASPASQGTIYGLGEYAAGSEISLSALPQPGYVFAQWEYPYNNQPSSFTITVAQDTNVIAYFAQDEADDDADGLTNYQEIVVYGTNPNDSDTDGDGFNDFEETQHAFLSPTVADTALAAYIQARVEQGQQQVIDNSADYGLYPEEAIAELVLDQGFVLQPESGTASLSLQAQLWDPSTETWTTPDEAFTYQVPVSQQVQLLRVWVSPEAE